MKPIRNPYKLQLVEADKKDIAVPKLRIPQPDFEVGDQVDHSFYHHSQFTILLPVIVRDMALDAHYTSGWKVGVDTTEGIKYLDSRYFVKALRADP